MRRSYVISQQAWWNSEWRRIAKERGCNEVEAKRLLAKQIAENRERLYKS